MATAESIPGSGTTADVTAFKAYERTVAAANARRAALLAAVFMLAGSVLDVVVFPDHLLFFGCLRVACSALLLGIYLYLRSASHDKHATWVSAWIALLPMLSICAMIQQTGGGNSVYYAGLIVVLVGLSLLLRWDFWASLQMTFTCAALYAASASLAPEPLHFTTFFNNCYFLFVISVFVLAGSYFYERLRFSEFCLRKELEASRELLRDQFERLGELDEAKTRFFANISHELRTPLTIMLGITERLTKTIPPAASNANTSESLHLLEQNGLRLMKLIDDLLDLVRFDTGHADLSEQPTAVQPHFEGLLQSLRPLAEKDQVALLWSCDAAPATVMLDRDKFDKILLNLVINAIKFTPSGGTIDVRLAIQNGQLSLQVEDTGVGIPKESIGRIFERFWQVDTSSTRKFQGSGIGLALVRSLAEAMHGSVQVQSEEGKGTTFLIQFPVAAADPSQPALLPATVTGESIGEIHRKAALAIPAKTSTVPGIAFRPHALPEIGGRDRDARPLVLIADDEPDIRRFLIMQLEDVEILEASDGAEALELCRIHRPQIALLDHMMPELDGVEVCRHIRENLATRETAVIILTARADESTKLAALQAGASDFLTKPFSSAELSLRLQNQVRMGRFRREMADLNRELQSALDRIKENEVLMLRNEKLSALGRMSAGIIHEINNPLNYANAGLHALSTFAPLIAQDERGDFEDTLNDIREGIGRVSQIVIDLRQFTRDEKSESPKDRILPGDVVQRAIRMVSHQLRSRIKISSDTESATEIIGNPNQLVQVLINLLQNSIDAIHQRLEESPEPPGLVEVSLQDLNGEVVLKVRDNGIGIPPENIRKIFDPFFTSKEVGKGMGLGLSISHQILTQHRAVVNVDSRPGEFTEIRLTFPSASTPSALPAPIQSKSS